MKKSLLFMCLMLAGSFGFGQVMFYVEAPSPFEGNYDLSFAEITTGDWGVADLNDPANAVSGILTFGLESSACDPLTNPEEVNGKIAVVYRGTCEFGLKALNAQNAGAIAVVIINNAPGSPIAMGGGANGLSVTVPVVMISQADGEILQDAIAEGNTTAFIGSKLNLYPNDAGSFLGKVLRPKAFAIPQATAQNGDQFSVDLGAWVYNWGSNDQDAVTLTAEIMLGDAVVYSETSDPVFIPSSGDSAYIALPLFSQESYEVGYYDVDYTINLPEEDGSPFDNSFEADFMITNSAFSLARLNAETLEPIGSYPATASGLLEGQGISACIHYMDPNASEYIAHAMTFAVVTDATSGIPLPEEGYHVSVYEWNDEFEDMDDPNFAISDLQEIFTDEYFFDDDLQGEMVTHTFSEEIQMEDNQRYLFCLTTNSPISRIIHDNGITYEENVSQFRQPVHPLNSPAGGTSWFGPGFDGGLVPAYTIHLTSTSGIDETDKFTVTPFPNPANATITIPVGEVSGKAELTMFDITGKIVKSQTVSVGNNGMLTANVADVENGVYVFSLNFETGVSSTFRVVVSK